MLEAVPRVQLPTRASSPVMQLSCNEVVACSAWSAQRRAAANGHGNRPTPHNTMPTRPHGSRYGCSQSTTTRAPCTSTLIVLGCSRMQRAQLTATSSSGRHDIGTTNTSDAPPWHTPWLQLIDDHTRTVHIDTGCARARQHTARTAHCDKQQQPPHTHNTMPTRPHGSRYGCS